MSEILLLREIGAEVQVEWRIEQFLSLMEDPLYHEIQSPAFSLSDAQWFLEMWPYDRTEDDSGKWIFLYLHKRFSTSKMHTIKYTLGIKRCDGSVYKSFDTEEKFQKFYRYAMNRFVQVSELRQSENVLTADGTLTVFGTFRLAEPTVPDKVEIVDTLRELTFRATHTEEVSSEWKVEGFTSLLEEQEDFSLKSPTFSLAGATWCMDVYPKGDNCDPKWVSLLLRRDHSSSEKQTVAFTLGIRKRDGTPHRVSHHEEEFGTNTGYGRRYFIKSSELLDSEDELVSEGSVTFFCTARATSSPVVTAADTEGGSQTSSDSSHEERASRTTPSERY